MIAGGVLLMRLVDIFWYTAPAFRPGEFSVHWMDLAAPLGLGGIWLATFLWQLRRLALSPVRDASPREVLERG